MTAGPRNLGPAIGGVAALVSVLLHAQGAPPSGQTFRTSTDVVQVDVSVRQGNTPVPSLTIADFELRDNGVIQRIEKVDVAPVPVDLTLVVDLSGYPASRMVRPKELPKEAIQIADQVAKVKALLRPEDKLRVLAVDTYVHEVMPLSSASALPPMKRAESGGLASTYDALIAAMLQPSQANRRRVVIANVSLFDTMSTVDAAAVRDVAARTDTLLHIVLSQKAVGDRATQEGFQCANAGVCWPVARSWVPQKRTIIEALAAEPTDTSLGRVPQLLPDGVALQTAATSTGGALHEGELFSAPSLAGTFARTFEDFRQSYVLRYTPQGVKREGWHAITVTVPSAKGTYTINARNGYSIDAPVPTPAITAPKPLISRPGTLTAFVSLPDLLAAYDRRDFDAANEALSQVDPTRLLQDFDVLPKPWPGPIRGEATFALELAAAGVFTRSTFTNQLASNLLQRYGRLIRPPIEPDDFEHLWMATELAMLQGRVMPQLSLPFIERSIVRFPKESRFHLARAIVTDQQWRNSGTVSFGDRLTTSEIPEPRARAVMELYEAAAAFPEVATEARVRLGWFLFRVGRYTDALAQLEGAPPLLTDPAVEYLRHLFKGRVFLELNRLDDVIAENRAASALFPGAQSARAALMNALTAKGDTAAAEAIAAELEVAPRALDPWWLYWLGDYRWYDDLLNALRGSWR